MHIKTIIIIGLILILACSIPVSATYEVIQGDTLYLGETVDISRVMSWSGQFAYFTNGIPGDYPSKIVDVNDVGHMYNHYIDPAKYNVGTWYKWDGANERAGNMIAFYIASGERNNTYISQLNHPAYGSVTPVPTQTPTLPAKIPQNTHILIARGDTGTLRYGYTNALTDPHAYIWLFGNAPDYDLTKGSLMTSGTLMGLPMNYTSSDSVNSFTFTPEISRKMQEGWYSGYIQYTGQNGIQDVFYNPDHKVKDNYVSILETPYDDDIIPDVPLNGYIPVRIQQEFEKLSTPSKYYDDILIPISVEVVTPSISIGDYWEESDNLIIRGSTPMSTGTEISVVIDPEQYVQLPEIRAHTFKTTAEYKVSDGVTIKEAECITTTKKLNNDGYNITPSNKSSSANEISVTKCTSVPRTFSISIPIKWSEMAIGHHTIRASIDKFGIQTSMNKDLVVSGEWVNPTPTQEFNKMIVVREGGSHLINVSQGSNVNSTGFPDDSPIPPTPVITQPPDVIVTMIPVLANTTQPTPIPTPVPEKPFDYLSMLGIIVVVVVVVIAGWLWWG